jgi:cytochrome c oxidase cbb3-type subunit 3
MSKVVEVMKTQKYQFPACIEYEYKSDKPAVVEVRECFGLRASRIFLESRVWLMVIKVRTLAFAATLLGFLLLTISGGVQALPQSQQPAQPAEAAPAPSQGGFGLSLALLPPPDPVAVDRGKQVFTANCAFCHGANATGGEGGPDLVRSAVVLHDEGKGTAIGPVILNGRPGTAMSKFDFSEAQIKDIAAFLLSRNQAAANRRTYQVLELATGDASAGKQYFDSHCVSCHLGKDDLAHVASKFTAPDLQGRFLYPPRRASLGQAEDPKAQKTVVVTLSSGQSYTGKLIHFDDFSVSLRDESGQYHSWELDGKQKGIRVEVHDPLEGHLDLLRKYSDADIHNVLTYLETLK